jgi:lambda family phage portal protein
MKPHWIDRVTAPLAPRWTLRRQHARIASGLFKRRYDAASIGRRTSGWRRSSGDGNAVVSSALVLLRENARDLVRNNPYAESALNTIVDHAVGWGIEAKPFPADKRAAAIWKAWAGTTDCDADGRHDFAGIQKLVMRTVVESGECLVRRRLRRPEDGFSLPLQLQVLDPDFLDTDKDGPVPGSGRIVHGVEFDGIGRRVAYWLFPEHPGSSTSTLGASVRVPAETVRHIFRPMRPGQVRGPSWFAPVLVRFRDYDEFEDATLMKQKIAACLAVITSDVDGTSTPLGTVDEEAPSIDSLEPGMIMNVPPGRSINVVQPPAVADYGAYSQTVLRGIAAGLGVTYEDMTGDYTKLPFSAARMSRLRHWASVEDWRWRILIPQLCDPVWAWAMEAAVIMSVVREAPGAQWSAPPPPMVDPANEGLAYQRNIRTGIMSLSEAIRERGYDPTELLEEIAADNKLLDRLGLLLDSDGRRMTQAGQAQAAAAAEDPSDAPAEEDDEEEPPQGDVEDDAAEEDDEDGVMVRVGPTHLAR